MTTTCLITGATGFLGGHLVEACAGRGWNVRALARASSDTGLLELHQATLIRGDMTDGTAIREALQGVEVVFHCAAKVGDWGPVEEYRAVNVEALRGLLDACRERSLKRFVHFSSLGVYAARHHHGTDENEPLPAHHIDGYTQTKVESEQLVMSYQRQYQLPVVVLRPGFIYGPRDRTLMPKLLENVRKGKFRYIGGASKRAMNCIYVGNLVEAALLAAEKPEAIGQIYNLTDGQFVSKKQFFGSIIEGLGLPKPPPVPVPLWAARVMAWWMEGQARKKNSPKAPRVTQGRLKLFGLNLDFSIEKAKSQLGYRPRWSFDEGMRETVAWYKQNA
ncbi:MAG TPA: NAD-dependent epimerase/dehydratase family protein [Gemmataceae bacterium]|nr:NAD-dependent epimerase/dehydratase family protein [Gemmataceae bacterium]